MKKITILIDKDTLIFKYRTNKKTELNLLNTNVISDNEVVFSDEYIIKNNKIVSLFINDLVEDQNIKNIEVSTIDLAKLVLTVVNQVSSIEKMTIKDESTLTYSICEDLINLGNIKTINCYSIPEFMIENLDKHNILVESRNEILFTSTFMSINELTSYSKIYYQKKVKIPNLLTEVDIEDLNTFFIINKYIKTIYLDNYKKENLEILLKILEENNEKNILIEIHDDIENLEKIEELKKINKEVFKKNKIKLSLVYSKDYVEKNYLEQIVFTTLKICSILMFAIIIGIISYIGVNNYQSEKKVNNILKEITPMIETKDNETNEIINSYDKLKEINNDTVGWLKIKGTNIDYPIVRAKDNTYYLTRNFYKEKDYNGWIFMDYRNNIKKGDDNTIIYAHNRYTSGVMFGTLPNIKKKDWLKNKENQVISFNTLYRNEKWQIFSYYNINVTSDYLVTNFKTDEEKENFIETIKKRSMNKFDVEVNKDDKILTLSTCLDDNKRFVVHAVLLDEEN